MGISAILVRPVEQRSPATATGLRSLSALLMRGDVLLAGGDPVSDQGERPREQGRADESRARHRRCARGRRQPQQAPRQRPGMSEVVFVPDPADDPVREAVGELPRDFETASGLEPVTADILPCQPAWQGEAAA